MPISRIETNSIAPSQTLTTPIIATTMGVGGATPSGSGSGITFPATQSASTDANTLDDYEEGTFTATFRGSGTAGTYTTSNQTATYTKIGRQVSVSISTSGFNAASGGSGYMQITGFPFSNTQSVSGAVQGNFLDVSAGTLWMVADFIGSSGQTIVYFREVKDAGNGNDFSIAGLSTSTSSVVVSLVYNTST